MTDFREAQEIYLSRAFGSFLPRTTDNVNDTKPPGRCIDWLSMNNNAKSVAFTLKPTSTSQCDSRIFVWQVTTDRIQWFDLGSGEEQSALEDDNAKDKEALDAQGNLEDDCKTTCNILQMSTEFVRGHYPVRHYWDLYDSRLLVVEAVELPLNDNHAAPESPTDPCTTAESVDSVDSTDDTYKTTKDMDRSYQKQQSEMTEASDLNSKRV